MSWHGEEGRDILSVSNISKKELIILETQQELIQNKLKPPTILQELFRIWPKRELVNSSSLKLSDIVIANQSNLTYNWTLNIINK
ncbi:hypothetical protein NQ315_017523 [Exocentrus adspersus]|uniref:Uncharacterized protein n=1 Tax=Exocentrus adspersus TaxID=1586481 RepID=A0AAV8VJU6_9CUCU|nr:hypothetical protein NQ315_017523 [Exocentrus adspersus]